MTQQLYIVIDIGGTAIKYGLCTAEGTFLEKGECPTEAKISGGPGIVLKVLNIAQSYLRTHPDAAGAAISTAGMVNPATGEIVYALPDAIPEYTGVNFPALLQERFSLKCTVENDVNCAALGELFKGSARGFSSIFCMTIGTSIGGALIINKSLVSGASYSAGEIAYMQIPGGRLHDLASTTALVRDYAQSIGADPDAVNGKLIFDRAENGEKEAASAIARLCDHLSLGIANVVSVVNPEAVVLGGGIMARSSYLKPLIEQRLKKLLKPIVFESLTLCFAELKNDAGMLGALYNFIAKNHS